MPTEVICALCSLMSALIGSFTGVIVNTSKTEFRLKQLEDKINMYNTINNRLSVLEVITKELQNEIKDMKSLTK